MVVEAGVVEEGDTWVHMADPDRKLKVEHVANETVIAEDGDNYEATFVTVRDNQGRRKKTLLAVGLIHAYRKEEKG